MVWFRLLRSLLDEVSLAPDGHRAHARSALTRVWAATGLPERGGLNVWRPYEDLAPDTQETMMLAAATALHLAAHGEITARGRLACAVNPPQHGYVYDGDRPDPWRAAWAQAVAHVEAMTITARTDADATRQLPGMVHDGMPHPSLVSRTNAPTRPVAGIPAPSMPNAAELGRTDLT